jgi:hypothetical protein
MWWWWWLFLMIKTEHTEVFCAQNALLLNFSSNVTHDCHSLLNNVKTQINKQTKKNMYRMFNLKVDHILIWVIYLLRFTTCYITQLTCIYSKCWKWRPFISLHLSTRSTMFLATFLSVLSFLIIFAIALFTGACLLNFSYKLCLQGA